MAGGEADFWSALPSAKEKVGDRASGLDLSQRYKRLRHLNAGRLEMFRRRLDDRQRDVFDVIPLLLHLSLPGAPGGNQAHRTATGILNFQSTPATVAAAGRLFPRVGKRTWVSLHRPMIKSVVLVCQAGTHGVMAAGGVELWVVIDERAAQGQLRAALDVRLGEISAWVAKRGLPIQLVPLTASQVQQGALGTSPGGDLHPGLRREQIYRSHVVLQGQAPLWWLAEPFCGQEEYAALGAIASWEGGVDPEGFVDLGWPSPVPPDEILTNALSDLAGGFVEPLGSVVDLVLLDRPLQGRCENLCEVAKDHLLSIDEIGPIELDPQLFLFDLLSAEALRDAHPERASLLQRAFFLSLIRDPEWRRGDPEATGAVQLLTERWGWDTSELLMMERFSRWDVTDVDRLGRELQIFFEGVVDRLRTYAPGIQPDRQEMLEAKIRGARDRAGEQVELLFTGYYPASLEQPSLDFVRSSAGWALFVGGHKQALRAGSEDLDSLLAFAAVNELAGPKTGVRLEGHGAPAPSAVLARLTRMAQVFGRARPERIPMAAFGQLAVPKRHLVEVAATPRESLGARGTLAVSEQWDLLDYGSQASCQVERAVVWTVDSHGAVSRKSFHGSDGVVELVLTLLESTRSADDVVIRFEPEGSASEDRNGAQRLERLLTTVKEALGRPAAGVSPAVMIRVEGWLFLFLYHDEKPAVFGPMAPDELSEVLARHTIGVERLVLDANSVHLDHVAAALEMGVTGKEQVFIYPDYPALGFVAVDAHGAVMIAGEQDADRLLGECSLALQVSEAPSIRRLVKSDDGTWDTAAIEFPPTPADVWVEGDLTDRDSMRFRIRGHGGRRAENFDEAATWLLSKWSVGLERSPRLALGRLTDAGQALPWLQQLRLRQGYSRLLGKAFRDQLAKVHETFQKKRA